MTQERHLWELRASTGLANPKQERIIEPTRLVVTGTDDSVTDSGLQGIYVYESSEEVTSPRRRSVPLLHETGRQDSPSPSQIEALRVEVPTHLRLLCELHPMASGFQVMWRRKQMAQTAELQQVTSSLQTENEELKNMLLQVQTSAQSACKPVALETQPPSLAGSLTQPVPEEKRSVVSVRNNSPDGNRPVWI